MELKSAIERRTSVRSFTLEAVDVNDLKEMVRRAGLAPSVNNSQAWKFIAITNRKLLKEMAHNVSDALGELPSSDPDDPNRTTLSRVEWFSTFFENAPAVLVMLMKSYESVIEKGTSISHDEINRLRNYPDVQSAGAAIQNILLTAVELNYGACWMSAPLIARERLEKILNIKNPWYLMTFVAVGRPFNFPAPKNKRSVDEIFEWIT
ncbi:MAG TPA: nitroreductase family protein [Bacteroidales bacterium]